MNARRVVAGRYRLEERIGSGAMGVVWRGTDERLGRVVAVKQVFLHGGLDEREAEEVRQRTLREGRIAARLQHPHAISVFDASIEGDEPWLVMEYLPSRSLAAVLADQGPLDPRLAARIGRQVADALDAAHQAGIVHRDVKPGNVLIGADGTVKITDFGISRATGDLTLTRTGMLAGTPAYLAPEVARGEDSTSASDVFSLGATLYAAVEGMPPFGADDNALALLHSVAAGRVIPPVQAGPLTALLMRLLRDDPTERPSPADARRELGRIATGGRGPVSPIGVIVTGGPDEDDESPASGVPAPRTGSSSDGIAHRGPPFPHPPPGPGDGARSPATRVGLPLGPDAPPGPARTGRRRHPTAAIVVAVLLMALVAGGVVGVALLGSSGIDDSGATVGEPTTSPTPADPRAQLVAAVREYYAVVTENNAAGWARLGPSQQNASGGFSSYQSFWSTISSVAVVEAEAIDDDTVRATLDFNPDGRSTSREVHELGMVRGPDDQWLINKDERIAEPSRRAATTEPPSGIPSPPLPSATPSVATDAVPSGRDTAVAESRVPRADAGNGRGDGASDGEGRSGRGNGRGDERGNGGRDRDRGGG